MRGNAGSGIARASIKTHARTTGGAVHIDFARVRSKVVCGVCVVVGCIRVRVDGTYVHATFASHTLCCNATLDCSTTNGYALLRHAHRLEGGTCRNTNLCRHKVEPGNFLWRRDNGGDYRPNEETAMYRHCLPVMVCSTWIRGLISMK